MQTFLQFGAGAAGRAVMGTVFAEAGFEVVFVDIDEPLIERLNEARSYQVIERFTGRPDRVVTIENVRGVSARNEDQVVAEVSSAALAGTSVGMRALVHVVPVLARAMASRPGRVLDVILGENMKHGARVCARHLEPLGSPAEGSNLSWVEACIGRMIAPVVAGAEAPGVVVTEPHCSLIVSESALHTDIGSARGLTRVVDIDAHIDRKLYIHNMAHATLAYAARRDAPGLVYVHEAIANPAVREATLGCMQESAQALAAAYPGVFDRAGLEAYIQDLLDRLANDTLADTLVRVGRDVARKLGRDDRLIGAMRLAVSQKMDCPALADAVVAALRFARDEEGLDEADRALARDLARIGIEGVLSATSELDDADEVDAVVRSAVLARW